jgi:hypothetical protein
LGLQQQGFSAAAASVRSPWASRDLVLRHDRRRHAITPLSNPTFPTRTSACPRRSGRTTIATERRLVPPRCALVWPERAQGHHAGNAAYGGIALGYGDMFDHEPLWRDPVLAGKLEPYRQRNGRRAAPICSCQCETGHGPSVVRAMVPRMANVNRTRPGQVAA